MKCPPWGRDDVINGQYFSWTLNTRVVRAESVSTLNSFCCIPTAARRIGPPHEHDSTCSTSWACWSFAHTEPVNREWSRAQRSHPLRVYLLKHFFYVCPQGSWNAFVTGFQVMMSKLGNVEGTDGCWITKARMEADNAQTFFFYEKLWYDRRKPCSKLADNSYLALWSKICWNKLGNSFEDALIHGTREKCQSVWTRELLAAPASDAGELLVGVLVCAVTWRSASVFRASVMLPDSWTELPRGNSPAAFSLNHMCFYGCSVAEKLNWLWRHRDCPVALLFNQLIKIYLISSNCDQALYLCQLEKETSLSFDAGFYFHCPRVKSNCDDKGSCKTR